MKCPFCSKEINDDALICSFCYKAVGSTITVGEPNDSGTFSGYKNNSSSKNHHTVHGIASFIIGIVSIVYLIFVINYWQDDLANSQMDPITAVITIALFCSPLLLGNFLGIYFGIQGKNRKDDVFSIIGIWINGIIMSLPLIYIIVILLSIISVGV